MTDEGTPDPNEPEEGEEGEEGTEGEGEELTPEQIAELREENKELKARLNKQRTAKAREARAKNRASGGGAAAAGGAKDEPNPLQEELDAEKERANALEKRLNTEQAQRLAAELGFRKPAHGVKLLEWDELVDPSDADEVKAALRDILKDDPALKKAPARADGGEGGGRGSQQKTSFNDIIRRAAGRA